MFKKLFLFVFSIFSLELSAQCHPNLEWVKQFGGTSLDNCTSIELDAHKNIYATGYFSRTADFDPSQGVYDLVSSGSNDVFILKLDSNGALLWAKKLGGKKSLLGLSIKVDQAGNVYVTGHFLGTVDFDPGPGKYNLSSSGGTEIFICKLDNSGNFKWAKQLGGIGPDHGNSISIGSNGDVLVTGYFKNSADFDPSNKKYILKSKGLNDAFVVSLDSNGTFKWAKQFGGKKNEFGYSIQISSSQFIYLTGYFSGTTDFDPNSNSTLNLSAEGQSDIFVCKLDLNGDLVWVKQIGGKGIDRANCIEIDSDDNLYITGHFSGTADFDPGTGTNNLKAHFGIDGFICKLSDNGVFVWAKQFGCSGLGLAAGNTLEVDRNKNVYLSGGYHGSFSFDGSSTHLFKSKGLFDAFSCKLDPSGNLIWAFPLSGTGVELISSVYVDNNDNIYNAGIFTKKVDFEPGAGYSALTSYGNTDIFVQKLFQGKAPIANFKSSSELACVGNAISFKDKSLYRPTSWQWTFEGGTPSTSTEQNPNIIYNSKGVFSVTLSVTNNCGTDTIVSVKNVTIGCPELRPEYCGDTLNTLDDQIQIITVPGAKDYEYRFRHAATGFQATRKRKNDFSDFYLTWVSGIKYGKTYDVDVRAFVNGKWSDYGKVCQLTTPNNIPGPNLIDQNCGITLTSLSTQLQVEAVSGATNYEYRVSHSPSGFAATKVRNNKLTDFYLTWIPGIRYGLTYDIEVRAFVGGKWGNYGKVCKVATPATIPAPELRPAYCGATLDSLRVQIHIDKILGATDYEYRFTHIASGFQATRLRKNHFTDFYPIWVAGLQEGLTYDVDVRAYVSGTWSSYGKVCQLTIRGDIPTIQLENNYCNITLNDLADTLKCESVNTASEYKFRITNTVKGYTDSASTTNSWYSLDKFNGVQYSNTYSVMVKAKVGGIWGEYGGSCNITTPSPIPSPKLSSNYCGITLTSINDTLYSETVSGATQYKFKISNNSLVYIDYLTNSNNYFSFNQLSWLQPNTTYVVEVQAYAGGQWGNYGLPCNVTTPGSLSIVQNEQTSSSGSLVHNNNNDGINTITEDKHTTYDSPSTSVIFNASIYPNPSNTGDVFLSINSPIDGMATIQLTDLMGRHIFAENIALSAGGNVVKQNYSSLGIQIGMYLVTITTNEGSYKTVERLVIK